MDGKAFEFTLDEGDAVRAARLAYAKRFRQPAIALLLLALYALIIAILAYLLGPEKAVELAIAAVIALPVAILLIARLLVPAMARANFRQSAGLRGLTRFSWDDEGFELAHDRGNLRLPWRELAGVTQRDDLLLLHQSDMVYNLVSLAPLETAAREKLATAVAAARAA